MTLGFVVGSKNFCKLFFFFLRSFCVARIRLNPLSCQILHHDSVSVIVSRLHPLRRTLLICCYQVTKIFCSRYGLASGLSARSPCNLGLLAKVAVSVLREVSVNTVRTQYHFSHRLWSWFMRRARGCVPVFWNSFVHKILREFFQPFWQIMQRVSRAGSVSSFYFWFCGFCWFWRQVSLCLPAGRNVETTESCGNDAGDVGVDELEEPVDKPGTTIDKQFSVVKYSSAFFNELWYLTTEPHIRISVICAEFSKWENCRCTFEKLCCHE